MTPSEEIQDFADIPLDIEVELDRKTMLLSQILELKPGSVVWLTRSAGENIDLYCGGALLGFGEIVVIESSMGIRITDFNTE
jgi:flagellar motor switch protein FliN